MKPKQEKEFSWDTLFLVTAISFFIFSGLTKLIRGNPVHSAIFLKIGIFSFVLFFLTLIAGAISNSSLLSGRD